MLTRRSILKGLPAVFAKPAHKITPVELAVPPDACDCHTHIIGDPKQFPFSPARVYTPEPASPREMTALHKALHIKRVVIVTPSVYGTDNSATIYGIKARGATARGIAVIDEKTPESDLEAMASAGIRGVRLNLATGKQADLPVARQRFASALDQIKGRNWHVQIYSSASLIAGIKDLVLASPVPVVFDHFGGHSDFSRGRTARIRRTRRTAALGQSLCENIGRLSSVDASARLRRCRSLREGTDPRESGSRTVGNGLASPQQRAFHEGFSAARNRRRTPVQSIRHLGARSADPPENTRR